MKPIAVLSSNLEQTSNWIRETQQIVTINKMQRSFTNKQGTIFIVIMNMNQVEGWEFSVYLIAPDYYSLLDIVKERIR